MVTPEWRTETFRELNRSLVDVLGSPTAMALAKLRLGTVGDLLSHSPLRYLSGTENSDLSELKVGEHVAVLARVARTRVLGGGNRSRLEVVLTDGNGALNCTFFGRAFLVGWWEEQLARGEHGIFVGKVSQFQRKLQLTHPDFVMIDDRGSVVGRADKSALVSAVSRSGLVPIYKQPAKLPTWRISECVDLVLGQLGEIDDPLGEQTRERAGVIGLDAALRAVHQPSHRDQVAEGLRRLRFDEALGLHLSMLYRRIDNAALSAARCPARPNGVASAFDDRLPFRLTAGQTAVGETIAAELAGEQPMMRLLQGEVGSGKTLVALRAMLQVVDSSHQAVLVAPTEVLAAQHADTLRRFLGDLGAGRVLGAPEIATDVALLTGSLSAARRRATLDALRDGSAGIVVGTHALFTEGVEFASLGLLVVDEQHRFGVDQRAALLERSALRPHVLVMTATPIPRSVAMTVFGDLEVSSLIEVPGNRPATRTHLIDPLSQPDWLDRAWQRIREEADAGSQTFVVCPRITASDDDQTTVTSDEAQQSATVEQTLEYLGAGALAGLRLASLHGRMDTEQKAAVMAGFVAGEIDVLVSTTVIEVGVDVPNATVMVILDADRFGISQLHQLRGRVGRGNKPGLCLLVSSAEPGSAARERLAAVASTTDGFELAELDLEQRREGNVLGVSQSGSRSALRLLRVLEHRDEIILSRSIAEDLVQADPQRADGNLGDYVTQAELLAAGDWLEKS